MEDPWASPWAAEPATRLPDPSLPIPPPDAPRQIAVSWTDDAWDSDWAHVAPSDPPDTSGNTQPPSPEPDKTQPSRSDSSDEHPEETSPSPRPVLFPVDLSHLDALFPPDAVQPRAIETFDTTDILANQTWRRVSRYGSSRKHNIKDGEYARVSWGESHIRARTLATLRRWISEDSASGHPRRTDAPSLFNWDSPAPPVSIGELLRRRRRSLSWSPSPAPVVAKRPVSMIQLTARDSLRPSLSNLRTESADDDDLRSERAVDDDLRSAESVNDGPRSAQTPVDNADGDDDDDDDDDDWGDMVVAEGQLTHMIAGAPSNEDEQVASILRSLPDLSYMLR